MCSPMARRAVLAVTVVIALVTGVALRGALPVQAEQQPDGKLKQQLEELLVTLRSLATMTEHAYKQGNVSAEEMYQSQQKVLRAELDVAENQKDRVSIHERLAKMAADRETMFATLVKRSSASMADAINAKVERIEAEIALERARGDRAP